VLALDQAGAGGGRTRAVPVPRRFAPWVEGAWIQRGRRPGPGGWRIVPDPNPHLILSQAHPGARVQVRLVGARSRFADSRGPRHRTLGVRFRAGALPALTALPAGELVDRSVDALALWRRSPTAPLVDAVGQGEEGGLAPHLERLLDHILGPGPGVDWRIRALEAGGRRGRGVGEVAERAGVAPRTLRAVAAGTVGLAPGGLLRIRRLHRALALGLGGRSTWEGAALQAGYHDPAHLTRSCGALLGEPPTTFAARRSDGPCRSVQGRDLTAGVS
jgi:AraC-like DNA-binding protein